MTLVLLRNTNLNIIYGHINDMIQIVFKIESFYGDHVAKVNENNNFRNLKKENKIINM